MSGGLVQKICLGRPVFLNLVITFWGNILGISTFSSRDDRAGRLSGGDAAGLLLGELCTALNPFLRRLLSTRLIPKHPSMHCRRAR